MSTKSKSLYLLLMGILLLQACSQESVSDVTPIPQVTQTRIVPSLTSTKMSSPTPTDTPLPTSTHTPPPLARPDYDKISGMYELIRSNGEGCRVKVILEPNIEPFAYIGFELLCIGHAPSLNSGYALARIRIADNVAVYSPDPACRIVFEFQDNQLKVTQIGLDADCGFGNGIYANGSYVLIDDKPPVLGCMRMDNPCNLPTATPFIKF